MILYKVFDCWASDLGKKREKIIVGSERISYCLFCTYCKKRSEVCNVKEVYAGYYLKYLFLKQEESL